MNRAFDLEQWLAGQGYAWRTVTEYSKWARRLGRWCHLHGHQLDTLEPHLLREWVDTTVPPGRESRKQARAACKQLYTMLGRQDEPWSAIRVPRKKRGNPQPLTDRQAKLLRDAAVMAGGREGLATLGMLCTACRPSEVAGWRWDGIDDGTIRYWRPKNSDWHISVVPPVLADALERFRPAHPEGFLFIGSGRPHVCGTTVWTWTKKVAGLAGLEGVTPKRLRSTAGSKVANEIGIDAAADVLGHSSVEVTRQFYTVVSDRRKQAAAALLNW